MRLHLHVAATTKLTAETESLPNHPRTCFLVIFQRPLYDAESVPSRL